MDETAYDDDIIYTYIHDRDSTKDILNNRLLQSYIDVCLSGCLELNEQFAIEFIETTHHWREILNDREKPRRSDWICTRADCDKIDNIMSEYLRQFHDLNLYTLMSELQTR